MRKTVKMSFVGFLMIGAVILAGPMPADNVARQYFGGDLPDCNTQKFETAKCPLVGGISCGPAYNKMVTPLPGAYLDKRADNDSTVCYGPYLGCPTNQYSHRDSGKCNPITQ